MKFKKVKQVKPIKESFTQDKIDAVKRSYRQKMGLAEDDPIIREDFKDYALEEVAMRQHLTKDDVVECLLGESVVKGRPQGTGASLTESISRDATENSKKLYKKLTSLAGLKPANSVLEDDADFTIEDEETGLVFSIGRYDDYDDGNHWNLWINPASLHDHNLLVPNYLQLNLTEKDIFDFSDDLYDNGLYRALDNIGFKPHKLRESLQKGQKVLTEDQDEATDVSVEEHHKKWADQINASVELDDDNDKSTIEKVLDATYRANLMNRATGSKRYLNVLFEGAQGTGKTSVIEQWAAKHGINLVNVKTSTLDEGDIGVTVVDRETNLPDKVTTSMFRALEQKKSVLFLDEYNRGRPTVRGTLLSLINEHYIPDASQPGGVRRFPNLIMTIAAINPFDANYQTYELDPAEYGRFLKYVVQVEIPSLRAHLERTFDYELSQARQKAVDGMIPTEDEEISIPLEAVETIINGRKSLAKALLSHKLSPQIFDTEEEASQAAVKKDISSTSRTLEAALMACNGTKDHFMYEWEHASNPAKVDIVEKILRQYHDVDDKANSAIGVGGKKKSAFEEDDLLSKVDDFLDSLN
jgi:hypothetical protein